MADDTDISGPIDKKVPLPDLTIVKNEARIEATTLQMFNQTPTTTPKEENVDYAISPDNVLSNPNVNHCVDIITVNEPEDEILVSINVDEGDLTSLNEEVDLGATIVHNGDVKIQGLAGTLQETSPPKRRDNNPKFIGNRIIIGNKPAKIKSLQAKCRPVKIILKDWYGILKDSKSYCDMCKILFVNEVSLLYHNSTRHSLKCNIIKHTADSKGTYVVDSNECKICYSSFSSRTNVFRHYRNVHNVDPQRSSSRGRPVSNAGNKDQQTTLSSREQHTSDITTNNIENKTQNKKVTLNIDKEKYAPSNYCKKPGPKSKTQNTFIFKQQKLVNSTESVKEKLITKPIDTKQNISTAIVKKPGPKSRTMKNSDVEHPPVKMTETPKSNSKPLSKVAIVNKSDKTDKAKPISKPKTNNKTKDDIDDSFCTHCNQKFLNKEAVIAHLYNLLQQKILTCKDCGEQFEDTEKFNTHNFKHEMMKNMSLCTVKITIMSPEEIDTHLMKGITEIQESYEEVDTESSSDKNTLSDNDSNGDEFIVALSDEESIDITDDENPNDIEQQEENIDEDEDNIIKEKYYRCPVCTAYFSDKTYTENHIKTLHGKEKGTYETLKLQPYDANCGLCHEYSYRRLKSYNQHVLHYHRYKSYRHLFINVGKTNKGRKPGIKPAPKKNKTPSKRLVTPWKDLKKSVFEYTCKICKEKFDDEDAAKGHVTDKHNDASDAIKATNVLRAGNHSLSVHLTLENPPVPKSVLFKCKKCYLHYFTSSAASGHHSKCPGPRKNWKCPICYRSFKYYNKEMHEKQHVYSEKFTVYVTEDKSNMMSKRILSLCPKCGVHFSERIFWNHYPHCGSEPPDSFYCTLCDILIDSKHKFTHKLAHRYVLQDDFILIEYEVPDKNATVTDLSAKRKLCDEDDVQMYEPPSKIFRTDLDEDWEKKMLYCKSCTCYLHPYRPNNVAHFESTCQDLPKVLCLDCGLMFTRRSMLSHKKVHEIGEDFSILDISFYDLNFKQIEPPMPTMPRCPVCMVAFETIQAKIEHDCGKTKLKRCYYCKTDFSDVAFKLHTPFHSYAQHKVDAEMSESQIKLIKNQINEKSTGILFTLYKCKDCGVVITNSENVSDHKKMKYNCTKLKNLYRHCTDCDVMILGKEYAHHTTRHQKNPKFIKDNMHFISFNGQFRNVQDECASDEIMKESDKYNYYECEQCKICYLSEKSCQNHTCVKDKWWCKICEIYLHLKTVKRHTEEHRVYSNMTRENVVIIKFNNNPIQTVKDVISDRNETLNNDAVEKEDDETDNQDVGSSEETVSDNNVTTLPKPNENTVSITEDNVEYTLYQCKICSVNHITEPNKHNCDDANNKCEDCDKKINSNDYEKHLEHHKNDNYDSEKVKLVIIESATDEAPFTDIYKCVCGFHFITEAGIFAHYENCGPRLKLSKQTCTKCGLLFNPAVLFNHLVTHHSKKNEFRYKIVEPSSYTCDDRDDVFKCSKCNLLFVLKDFLLKHIKVCDKVKRNGKICSICNMEFDRSMLPFHLKKHHMIKKFNSSNLDVKVIGETVKENDLIKTDTEECTIDDEVSVDNKDIEVKSVNTIITSIDLNDLHNDDEVIRPKSPQKNEPGVSPKLPSVDLSDLHNEDEVEKNKTDVNPKLLSVDLNDLNIDGEVIIPKSQQKKKPDNLRFAPEHFSNVLFKCTKCDINYMSPRTLKSHYEKKHVVRDAIVVCKICDLKFTDYSLPRHEYVHHTTMKLSVNDLVIKDTYVIKNDCAKSKYRSFKMNSIALEKLKCKPLKKVIYKCNDCDLHYVVARSVQYHVETANHKYVAEPQKCDVCNIYFSPNSLYRHKYIHHTLHGLKFEDLTVKVYPDIADDDDEDKCYETPEYIVGDMSKYTKNIFKCGRCNVNFLLKHSLYNHVFVQEHTIKEKIINCDVCSLNFTRTSLLRHKYIHHKIMNLKNSEGFVVKDENTLMRRPAKSAVEKPKEITLYKCKICNIHFVSQETCKRHFHEHKTVSTESIHKCNKCLLNFRKKSLIIHNSLHHEKNDYKLNEIIIAEYDIVEGVKKISNYRASEVKCTLKQCDTVDNTSVSVEKDTDLAVDEVSEAVELTNVTEDQVKNEVTTMNSI